MAVTDRALASVGPSPGAHGGGVFIFSKEPGWPGGELPGHCPFGLRAALLPLSPASPAGVGPGQTFPSRRAPEEAIRHRVKDGLCQRSKPAGSIATLYGSKAACGKRQQGCPQSKGVPLSRSSSFTPTGPGTRRLGENRHPGFCRLWRFFWHLCGIALTMQEIQHPFPPASP